MLNHFDIVLLFLLSLFIICDTFFDITVQIIFLIFAHQNKK